MKKVATWVAPHVAVLAVLLLPALASADGLVPCGGRGEPECQLKHLIQMGNGIITFLIQFAVLVAVVLLAIGGFKLVLSRGNAGAMEEAKSRIWNVFIGFLIILLAYLVIETILTVLTGGGFDTWRIR
jgi:amino acid transporter